MKRSHHKETYHYCFWSTCFRHVLFAATLFTLTLLYSGHGRCQNGAAIEVLRKAVVRIHVVAQVPDYSVPWSPGQTSSGSGSGFVIEGNRILTNAHISSNARFIAVVKEGDARQYEARVRYIAHDCDLAVLEVIDSTFFDGMTRLELGAVPPLDSTVVVLGYPIGGNRLSVTRGVVSRIDFQTYSHSSADSHLAIQIDAAINPGNSGGPVIQDNKVVGVAFQGYSGMVAQNVGYMIPVPVIHRFLTDIQDGQYDHYVDLGIYHFPLINSAQRQAIGLGPNDDGVLVGKVFQAGAAFGYVQPGDVLLAIDGNPIFSDGRVQMDGERILLNEIVERKYKGDTVQLLVWRKGHQFEVQVPLSIPWPYLMQSRRHDVRPRYVVFAGLVFQPLSLDFMRSKKINRLDVLYYYHRFLEDDLYIDKPEVIIISKILPDPINTYLQDRTLAIIESINEKKVQTLEDVAAAFDADEPQWRIRLVGSGRPIVFERDAVEDARKRIADNYNVLKPFYLGDAIVPENWNSKGRSSQ
jgi:S1-C subfamily serine protease